MWEQPTDLGYGVLTNLTWLEAVGSMDQIALLTNLRILDIRYAQDTKIEVRNINIIVSLIMLSSF